MNHEEPDELWNLLGKAREPKVRPFFSAKVMQAIREEEQEKAVGGFWMMVRRWWHVSVATGAVAAVAVFLALPSTVSPPISEGPEYVAQAPADPLAPLIVAVSDADELGATLDNLLATQDNSIWLQADLSLP